MAGLASISRKPARANEAMWDKQMAIRAKRVTGIHLERADQQPGRHGVGDGLMMQVRAPGRASWVWRYQVKGRRREMGLGAWPEVSLPMARDRLFKAKRMLANGSDPLAVREAEAREEA